MTRKLYVLFLLPGFLLLNGCIKQTYDLTKLDDTAHLSPAVAVSAVRGDISFSDLVKENDTVVFGTDKFVRLVFKKDSVVYFKMSDYYNLNNMVNFSDTYPIGNLSLAPFSASVDYTLDEISQHLSTTLRAKFLSLNGLTDYFPSFPTVMMTEKVLPTFSNFEYATFSQGFIDVVVRNNLTAPLYGATVTLYNTTGHTQIGSPVTISAISAGSSGTASVNIAGLTVRNSITAAVTINGSEGTDYKVLIDLYGSSVNVSASGRDLKVSSGRVVIYSQPLTSFNHNDTIPFNPGTGVEISYIKMNAGNVTYKIQSGTSLKATVSLSLPTTNRGGSIINESFVVNPNATTTGPISVNNTTIDLSTRTNHPYNLLPIVSDVSVTSDGALVIFSNTSQVKLDLSFLNPDFDYVRGYFGQQTETIDKDTLDLGIKNILDHITGSFLVSDPSIKLSYSNSFAIPVQITLDAKGYRKNDVVSLGLAPAILNYPAAPSERVKNDVFSVTKDNSQLPQLVSMPPEKVVFSGSAKMNPQGNSGSWNNYLFPESRFLGDLEITVPLQFRVNNLQFADTVDNFMNDTGDSPVKPENFEYMRIDITAENGFPFGSSLRMILYSTANGNIDTVSATDVLKPAPVDASGKVTAAETSTTSILVDRKFWSSVTNADRIIFSFLLNTTDNGSKDVKIYSDDKINFKASLVLKPDIRFSIK